MRRVPLPNSDTQYSKLQQNQLNSNKTSKINPKKKKKKKIQVQKKPYKIKKKNKKKPKKKKKKKKSKFNSRHQQNPTTMPRYPTLQNPTKQKKASK
jgi:hypothetical protein